MKRAGVAATIVAFALGIPAVANAACNTTFTPPTSPYNGKPIDIVTQGANCNGSCSDTAIFQSAITYLQGTGNGQGGEIDLPATRACAVNLSISGNGIRIVGRGKYSSQLVPFSSDPVITVTSVPTSPNGNYGIELRDLSINSGAVGASAALYITGPTSASLIQTPNDDHTFEHLNIYSNPSHPFVNGIKVDGRMIWAQFNDVQVNGTSGNACQFDTSQSVSPGAPIYHDSFRDLQCNGSTGGWGLVVLSPDFEGGGADVYAFHTLDFDHINVQNNYLGGIYIGGANVGGLTGGVEEGGIYNSYIEANGVGSPSGGPSGMTTYGIALQGKYAAAFNVVGNLVWSSGVGLYNDTTYSTGLYYGNRLLGSTVDSTYYADLAVQTGSSTHGNGLLVGGNYDNGNYGLGGNVVVVPDAPGNTILQYPYSYTMP